MPQAQTPAPRREGRSRKYALGATLKLLAIVCISESTLKPTLPVQLVAVFKISIV